MGNDKIEYGDVDVPEVVDRKDVMITISLRMEGDLLDTLRSRAEEKSLPYQTFIKQILREHATDDDRADLVERVKALEELVQQHVLGKAGGAKKSRPTLTKRGRSKKAAG